MDNKRLLEELRASVGNYKPEKSKKEEKLDIEDVVEDEDRYKEDDEDLDDYADSDNEDTEEYEDEDEEGIDLDGDGEADDIHGLHVLKSNFNAVDEETQNSIAGFLKMVVENEIDLDTLSQFVEDLDYGDEDEYEEGEDEYREDNESEEGEESEEEYEDNYEDEDQNESVMDDFLNVGSAIMENAYNSKYNLHDKEEFSSMHESRLDFLDVGMSDLLD